MLSHKHITNGHKVTLIATKFCVDGFATARETVKYGSGGDISKKESNIIKIPSVQVAKGLSFQST